MIFFEDKDGLCCRPPNEIASVTPAFPDRLRIDCTDGCVGYCYDATDQALDEPCSYSEENRFDPRQLRRIDRDGNYLMLTLNSWEKLRITPKWVPLVRASLGLDRYKPQPDCLTRSFLREYPFEIAWAPAEVLKLHFPTARLLIASDWEELFQIGRADSAMIPRFSLNLVPRRASPVDEICWRTQELDSQLCLSIYNSCLARLEGKSWLKQWKSASADRNLELRIDNAFTYDAREWERAGLPGHKSHELCLTGPDGQRANLLIGEETDLCLVVSNTPSHRVGPHWLDNLSLGLGREVATVANDGKITRIRLEQP